MESGLGLIIRNHWERYLPKTSQRLKASNQWEAAMDDLERRALDVWEAALDRGLSHDQARELDREVWCLPEEEDTDEEGEPPPNQP